MSSKTSFSRIAGVKVFLRAAAVCKRVIMSHIFGSQKFQFYSRQKCSSESRYLHSLQLDCLIILVIAGGVMRRSLQQRNMLNCFTTRSTQFVALATTNQLL